MKILTDHKQFPEHGGNYFNKFDGYTHAYFMPDNVIYIAPSKFRYLVARDKRVFEFGLQHLLITDNYALALRQGYNSGKQYNVVHENAPLIVVYAFTAAFNEVVWMPTSWFDQIKNLEIEEITEKIRLKGTS